jgi:protein PhnA
MTVEPWLLSRSFGKCELCQSSEGLATYELKPAGGPTADAKVLICTKCESGLEEPQKVEGNHWLCLRDSVWAEAPAVQVLSYRILQKLGSVAWAQDLLGQVYFPDDLQAWADAGLSSGLSSTEPHSVHVVDSNGSPLHSGDTVTLIKDLQVKGANFTAKRGTTVKNISLTDDPKHVEGRVNGIRIVLVAAFLKKA